MDSAWRSVCLKHNRAGRGSPRDSERNQRKPAGPIAFLWPRVPVPPYGGRMSQSETLRLAMRRASRISKGWWDGWRTGQLRPSGGRPGALRASFLPDRAGDHPLADPGFTADRLGAGQPALANSSRSRRSECRSSRPPASLTPTLRRVRRVKRGPPQERKGWWASFYSAHPTYSSQISGRQRRSAGGSRLASSCRRS